jgi:cytochrome c oxidase cbb3-type subunit III
MSGISKAMCAAAGALLLAFGPVARADNPGETVFKQKCTACHAADGSGNNFMGKKLNIPDLRSPEVQKQTDAALTDFIAKGKNKMPAYEKTLKPEEIKGLVTYIRSIAKK